MSCLSSRHLLLSVTISSDPVKTVLRETALIAAVSLGECSIFSPKLLTPPFFFDAPLVQDSPLETEALAFVSFLAYPARTSSLAEAGNCACVLMLLLEGAPAPLILPSKRRWQLADPWHPVTFLYKLELTKFNEEVPFSSSWNQRSGGIASKAAFNPLPSHAEALGSRGHCLVTARVRWVGYSIPRSQNGN